MEAFVYCWTDHKTNKMYVGSHKGCPLDGYICSSKFMKEQYNKRSENFGRQIIAIGALPDMRKLEECILKSVNAAKDPLFYNQHNCSGKFYLKQHTEQSKAKMRSHIRTEHHCENISKAKIGKAPTCAFRSKVGKNNSNYGNKASITLKEKLSKAHRKYTYKVGDVIYDCIGDIAKQHGITKSSAWARFQNPNFPLWVKHHG